VSSNEHINRSLVSDAYIVFTNDSGHWWSRFLHPFIKHCYLMIADRGRWLIYGKSMHYVDLFTIDRQPDKIEEVIIVKIDRKTARQSLFMLNTCVGHVKQILGINRPFIWTPYQLYKYLEKTK
jgi:hypothetical protein